MNYKNWLPSQKQRFFILRILKFLPDSVMLALQYYIKMGRFCDFKKPLTWTEKLQLYKMHYRNPLLGICVDKFKVRAYVEQKKMSHLLVKLYGSYEHARDIDFDKLPNQFVLKTTDGGGGKQCLLVKDKRLLDVEPLRKKLDSWLNIKDINAGREWAYTQIEKSQIIAEELLINPLCPEAGIEDFKILCFHGAPKYIIVDKDRYIDHKRDFYDTNWERVDVTTDHGQLDTAYPRPKNLSEMLEIAKILSQDFPFVRVDLYNINNKIYFGELTFYPWSGYVMFKPEEFDKTLGALLDEDTFFRDFNIHN